MAAVDIDVDDDVGDDLPALIIGERGELFLNS
jgi:hypothetical protein